MRKLEFATVEPPVKKELVELHAQVEGRAWFEEVIDALDDPISEALVFGYLTAPKIERIIQNWTASQREARHVLWAFDPTQYPNVFGYLIADLAEDGKTEEVRLFYEALKNERERT